MCSCAVGVDWLANYLRHFLHIPCAHASLFLSQRDWYELLKCAPHFLGVLLSFVASFFRMLHPIGALSAQ